MDSVFASLSISVENTKQFSFTDSINSTGSLEDNENDVQQREKEE